MTKPKRHLWPLPTALPVLLLGLGGCDWIGREHARAEAVNPSDVSLNKRW